MTVLEKEYSSKLMHANLITSLRKISDSEFMSCSVDMSLKVWDKHQQQGPSYTIETEQPLHYI